MVGAKCCRQAIQDAYSDSNQQPDTYARHSYCHANQYTFSSHHYSYFHSRVTYANARARSRSDYGVGERWLSNGLYPRW